MQRFRSARPILAATAVGLIVLLSSCAAPPPPPPPSVAPPPVVRIPPRPYPPMGAPAGLAIPPPQADGTRFTVNSNLTTAQTVWNLRSAYNVAALNCLKSKHTAILSGYSSFLKTHAKTLKAVNRDLDRKFRAAHRSKYIRMREAYQTRVYNFFALPPVIPALCDAALALSQDLVMVAPGQLEGFAPTALARFDGVYQKFFASFDQYKADLAAWEERYGTGRADAAVSSSSHILAQ